MMISRFLLLLSMSAVAVGQTPIGHIVWGPEPGGYVCQPWGARCRVPTDKQIAAHKPKPKEPKWTPDSIIEQPNDSLILVPDPCDGVGCYTPSVKKSIAPTFTMPIGGMYCCTDEQMGIPSCPKGYAYNRPLGARNGTCDPEQPGVTKPEDITALMEQIVPTGPKPITVVEPVTQPVLHCPEGWHPEVWHAAVCTSCGTFSVPQAYSFQDRPAGYGTYYPPSMFDDAAAHNSEHPPRCVKETVK